MTKPERPDVGARYTGKDDGPWQRPKDRPDREWREWQGEKRIEFLVPVSRITSFVRKLLGRKEKS